MVGEVKENKRKRKKGEAKKTQKAADRESEAVPKHRYKELHLSLSEVRIWKLGKYSRSLDARKRAACTCLSGGSSDKMQADSQRKDSKDYAVHKVST
jgi:hypothetical protein